MELLKQIRQFNSLNIRFKSMNIHFVVSSFYQSSHVSWRQLPRWRCGSLLWDANIHPSKWYHELCLSQQAGPRRQQVAKRKNPHLSFSHCNGTIAHSIHRQPYGVFAPSLNQAIAICSDRRSYKKTTQCPLQLRNSICQRLLMLVEGLCHCSQTWYWYNNITMVCSLGQ
jgi:hypothetical protein